MTQNKFKKIFVGGLPPQTTESDMRQYFSKYGDVCDVVAMRDKTGNKSRGFGFVVFKDADSVDRCQAERPHQLLGKIVDTKRAMPKEESLNPDIHCNSKRIFIGGIRRFFTEDDLKEYFGNFGEIVDCTIKRDNVSGLSRGFAFITFTDRDIVDKVILSKPHTIRHCIVDVKKALSPEELRQLDESNGNNTNTNSNTNVSTNNSNNNDFDNDLQRIYNKHNQDTDEDTKSKEKVNKKITKRSQSYPPTEYPNYMGYYVLPTADMNGINASSTTAYPYDHHVPMIWMAVQQYANGYLLTPVSPDMYTATNYPSYFYHSSSLSHTGGYNISYSPIAMFSEIHQNTPENGVGGGGTTSPTIVSVTGTGNIVHGSGTNSNNNTNNSSNSNSNNNGAVTVVNCFSDEKTDNNNLSVSELKNVLPDETDNHHSNNSIDDYASEETAFGSPNSESL